MKTYGLKITARGGKVFKKKATVVVARKLADMIYTLWQTCEAYDLHYKSQFQNVLAHLVKKLFFQRQTIFDASTVIFS